MPPWSCFLGLHSFPPGKVKYYKQDISSVVSQNSSSFYLNIFLGKQLHQIVDCCRGDAHYHPVLAMLTLVICNVVLQGLRAFSLIVHKTLEWYMTFVLFWILRALASRWTQYSEPLYLFKLSIWFDRFYSATLFASSTSCCWIMISYLDSKSLNFILSFWVL